MTPIGKRIEDRRRRLGLSRGDLAASLGVSSQTILNVERDPTYNLGTRLLDRLAAALDVEFHIIMKEKRTMSSNRITMGNDEFILYIRKNHRGCTTNNAQLGKRIWAWLREHASGVKLDSEPTLWGGPVTSAGLPGSAHQFEFDRAALPDLYRVLDQLGSGAEAA